MNSSRATGSHHNFNLGLNNTATNFSLPPGLSSNSSVNNNSSALQIQNLTSLHKLAKSPHVQTALLNQGSITQRAHKLAKHDWNKTTSIISQKPFNQNRSIDNRGAFAMIQKKNELNNQTASNSSAGQVTTQRQQHHQSALISNGAQEITHQTGESDQKQNPHNQQNKTLAVESSQNAFMFSSYQHQYNKSPCINSEQQLQQITSDKDFKANSGQSLYSKTFQAQDTKTRQQQLMSAKNSNWLTSNITNGSNQRPQNGNQMAVQNINRLSSSNAHHNSGTPSNNFLMYQMSSNQANHYPSSKSNEKLSQSNVTHNSLIANLNFRSQKHSHNHSQTLSQGNGVGNRTLHSSNSSNNLMPDSAILNHPTQNLNQEASTEHQKQLANFVQQHQQPQPHLTQIYNLQNFQSYYSSNCKTEVILSKEKPSNDELAGTNSETERKVQPVSDFDKIVSLRVENDSHDLDLHIDQKNRIFSELSNNLETVRAYRVEGQKNSQLTNALRNFAPSSHQELKYKNTQKTSNIGQRQNAKNKSSEGIDRQIKNRFKLNGKSSFDDSKLEDKLNGAKGAAQKTFRIQNSQTPQHRLQEDQASRSTKKFQQQQRSEDIQISSRKQSQEDMRRTLRSQEQAMLVKPQAIYSEEQRPQSNQVSQFEGIDSLGDVTESIIMFKQSTHDTRSNGVDSEDRISTLKSATYQTQSRIANSNSEIDSRILPKEVKLQGDSQNNTSKNNTQRDSQIVPSEKSLGDSSSKKTLQIHEYIHNFENSKDLEPINILSINKDSRNKLNQVFLSHQLKEQEGSKMLPDEEDQKTICASDSDKQGPRATLSAEAHLQPYSATRKDQYLTTNPQKGSSSKKMKAAKYLGSSSGNGSINGPSHASNQKASGVTSNKQSKNFNSSGIISFAGKNGAQTPQEVFNYKLKAQNSATFRIDSLINGSSSNKAATNSEVAISNPSSIQQSSRMQKTQGLKKTSVSSATPSSRMQQQSQMQNTNGLQSMSKPPPASGLGKLAYGQSGPQLTKSESEKQILYSQKTFDNTFGNDANNQNVYIDTSQNCNFIYQTLQQPSNRGSIPIETFRSSYIHQSKQNIENQNVVQVPPNSQHLVSPETAPQDSKLIAAVSNAFGTNLSSQNIMQPLNLMNQMSSTGNFGGQAPDSAAAFRRPPIMKNKEFEEKLKALDEELEQAGKDHKQQIKVVGRFRPFNPVETELKETYRLETQERTEVIKFLEDGRSLKVSESYTTTLSQNMIFTFDHIFRPDTSQAEVFHMLGRETIEDIMEGYNGTIFAYGQTGSGKTYTMYGQDMFDEELMGIIPRAARQIFQHIKDKDLEIEYSIRVQMVEIYKEQLRDLLHDTPDAPPELKIKEDPKRGTYVEGLNSICIVSEEEMMAVLCTGETMRHVASTNLNKHSSRSHSICIIEIVQKYPNDSERRGILNLVDLAGSERVSKSHAQGEALEEAKKINYSLSALGKVINSLSKNGQHVPYRDSKLTRLLKESLGGNNKTSLIVACSLHHSNIEETISTLRFAQSAKFIKNKVKLNIKTSPEQLQIIIEQLKNELRTCKEEINRLRITNTNSIGLSRETSGPQTQQMQLSQSEQQYPEEEYADAHEFQDYRFLQQNGEQLTSDFFESNKQPAIPNSNTSQQQIENSSAQKDQAQGKHAIHNRPHQSLLAKNYDVIETNNQRMQMLSLLNSDLSSIIPVPGGGTPAFISPVKNYELKLMQLVGRNEELELKVKSKESDVEALQAEKEELQFKVQTLEEKLLTHKQKLLGLEKRVAEQESDRDFLLVNEVKQVSKMEDLDTQIEIMGQQIQCLEKALEDSEQSCQELLKEKQTLYQKSIKDFLNETIKLRRLKVSDALDNFINKPQQFHSQQQLKKSFISQLDLVQDFKNQEQLVKQSEQLVQSLNERDLLSRNIYCLETINALEDTPPELTIYLLKQLVIEASLANHNLQRILAVNRWRQVMEYGKNKIKSVQCKLMEGTIHTLDQVLDRTRKTHDRLRERVDKLENHLYDNRNYYGDVVLMTDANAANTTTNLQAVQNGANPNLKKQFLDGKAIIGFNSLKDKTQNLMAQNQSIANLSQSNYQQHYTTAGNKSRFVRTITNKTLGKVFNFMERSPVSRGSICGVTGGAAASNQSIISHYYGQRQQNYTTYRPGGGTPIRAGGISSPLYNFQSPIRRQHHLQATFVNPQTMPVQQSNLPFQAAPTNEKNMDRTQLMAKQQNISNLHNENSQQNSQLISNFQQNSNLLIYSNDSNSFKGEGDDQEFSKRQSESQPPKLTKELLQKQEALLSHQNLINLAQVPEVATASNSNDSLSQQFTFQNNTQSAIQTESYRKNANQPFANSEQQQQIQKVMLSQQNSNNNILLLSSSSTTNQLMIGATSNNNLGSGGNSNYNLTNTNCRGGGIQNTTCIINNEQMNFEDAIVQFFNSSELEGKNAQRIKGLTSDSKGIDEYGADKKSNGGGIKLNHEDLMRIENINSLSEIKDYLRSRFQRHPSHSHIEQLQNSAAVHLNPLFAQYQTNAAYHNNNNNSSSNLQNSQAENNPQINSHTTNNNLYAQSNDFYDNQDPSDMKGVPCSSSGHYHDNQRQEHVMTLASEYMITSNSVIGGPSGLFSGNGGVQLGLGAMDRGHFPFGLNHHQNDYLDRLQEKIVQLQEEVDTQKCRADEHKKAYYESKRQIEQMRDLMEDKESKHNSILKSEIFQWEGALTKFKEMNENELLKKQKEIEKLHEILAQWIENYQVLQSSKNNGANSNPSSLDKLIQETMRHKRQRSGLLSEVMKSPSHQRRRSGNQPNLNGLEAGRAPQPQRILKQNLESNQIHSKSSYKMHMMLSNASGSNMNPNLNQNSEFDKKRINGDNSPVAQEDSCCYDIEHLQVHTHQSIISHNHHSSSIFVETSQNQRTEVQEF